MDGITNIGRRVFEGCSGLTTPLELPDGITIIDMSALEDSSGLTDTIAFPDAPVMMHWRVFNHWSLAFPDGVKGYSGLTAHRCCFSMMMSDNGIGTEGVQALAPSLGQLKQLSGQQAREFSPVLYNHLLVVCHPGLNMILR